MKKAKYNGKVNLKVVEERIFPALVIVEMGYNNHNGIWNEAMSLMESGSENWDSCWRTRKFPHQHKDIIPKYNFHESRDFACFLWYS